MSEVWKAVLGFEGMYEVSSLGRIRSLDRYIDKINRWGSVSSVLCKGRILSTGLRKDGYQSVSLYDGGLQRATVVHILICEAFRGPKPFPNAEVRHLDGDKANCREDNLVWGTRLENEADKEVHGTRLKGEQSPSAKLTKEDVIAIRRRVGEPQQDLADEFGCTRSNISAIQLRKSWKHV